MNKNYLFSTLFATMSCTTVAISSTVPTNGENYVTCPELSVEIPVKEAPYILSSQNLSFISSPFIEVVTDFEVLASFAKKLLNSEVSIDEEIQHVIEDNFWDML